MDYNKENEQIRQRLEQLFAQAKRKCGSWANVAKELSCDYSSVARYRRKLKDNSFPALPFYFRLCRLVEDRDHHEGDSVFLLIAKSDFYRFYVKLS